MAPYGTNTILESIPLENLYPLKKCNLSENNNNVFDKLDKMDL
jgi:hypothetical protein